MVWLSNLHYSMYIRSSTSWYQSQSWSVTVEALGNEPCRYVLILVTTCIIICVAKYLYFNKIEAV
jgi:putative exporter of polyketide antibiotics